MNSASYKQIGNKHFKILMKYLKDLKGKSREETLAKAKDVMEKPDEGIHTLSKII